MKLIKNTADLAKSLGLNIKFNLPIQDFQIDSRNIKKNSVFFGLEGTKEDGSIYANQALKKGAALAIIKRVRGSKSNSKNSKILEVRNPSKALVKVAKNVLKQYIGYIIGVTGSNGKTTTKNILNSGIEKSFATFQNFNNEIGLPLCALSLDSNQNVAIFEMGAAKRGDIDFLSNIIKPHLGIITHIGHSHLAGLNSLSGVLDVKSELLNHIRQGGAVILPYGAHLRHWKSMRDDILFYTFGLNPLASFFPSNIQVSKKGTSFFIESKYLSKHIQIRTPLLGNHNILNILASFAAVYESKSSIEFFVESLKSFQNSPQRLQLRSWIKQSRLIDDSYNANPDSVKAAIDVLNQFEGRKILILGDMKELGRFRKKLHIEIGDYAKMHGVDLLMGFGDLTRHSVKSFGHNGMFFQSKDELRIFLKKEVSKEDNILLKGSRGMKMEEVLSLENKND